MKEYEVIIEKLKSRQAELQDRLNKVAESLRKTHAKDWEEQAIERENEEVVEALDESIRTELSQITVALDRVEKDEYGICSICDDPIPTGRLEALPYTDRCVSCASEME
ncbi:MAG: TraR/DksA family transcriptional regulator [Deltaproteobacteria bacterium]